MHKCIPYAQMGVFTIVRTWSIVGTAERINAFPTKQPDKFQFTAVFAFFYSFSQPEQQETAFFQPERIFSRF